MFIINTLFTKQRGAARENDNCVGLKLAKNSCVAPGTALHRVYDRALGVMKRTPKAQSRDSVQWA